MQNPPYDAVLIVSFGGPERLEDVIPFLENVLRGKNVPRERLIEVAHHYEQFDGVSPLNNQNRTLIANLVAELNAHGPQLPVYWGNRNWHPLLADTLGQMAADGIHRALAFVTSAYSSYSGCRQYLEDIERARQQVGPQAPKVDKLRAFYNHPGFIEPTRSRVREAWEQIPQERRNRAHLLYTAHSIPLAMAANCRYEDQLQEACELVSERLYSYGLDRENWRLVYQSRSGPSAQPWLEPDVRDSLRVLQSQGVRDVAIAPIGFLSDHMEILFDLDTEARELCEKLGINMVRAETVGSHPEFVAMIRELILERVDNSLPRRCLGTTRPVSDFCPADCCASGRPVQVAQSSAT